MTCKQRKRNYCLEDNGSISKSCMFLLSPFNGKDNVKASDLKLLLRSNK